MGNPRAATLTCGAKRIECLAVRVCRWTGVVPYVRDWPFPTTGLEDALRQRQENEEREISSRHFVEVI